MSRKLHDHAIAAYFKSHQRAIKLCFERLLASPIANLMTLMVITLAFFLPTALFVTLENVDNISKHWETGTQIHLYLTEGASKTQATQLAEKLSGMKPIQHVDIIYPEQGLQDYISQTHSENSLDATHDNPLPTVLVVHPAASQANFEALDQLKNQLSKLDGIELATLDNLWIKRLDAIKNLLRQLFYGLVITLGFGIIFVIASSVRSTSQQYHPEITLFDMVGATPAYIRRPFLYTGVILGLLAGALTLALIITSVHTLTPAIQSLSRLYDLNITPSSLSWKSGGIMVLSGLILGYIGSFAAISLEIKKRT